jgi:hypothetical protein
MAAPTPIKVKSDSTKLAHNFAALGVPHKTSGNGGWKEFQGRPRHRSQLRTNHQAVPTHSRRTIIN